MVAPFEKPQILSARGKFPIPWSRQARDVRQVRMATRLTVRWKGPMPSGSPEVSFLSLNIAVRIVQEYTRPCVRLMCVHLHERSACVEIQSLVNTGDRDSRSECWRDEWNRTRLTHRFAGRIPTPSHLNCPRGHGDQERRSRPGANSCPFAISRFRRNSSDLGGQPVSQSGPHGTAISNGERR